MVRIINFILYFTTIKLEKITNLNNQWEKLNKITAYQHKMQPIKIDGKCRNVENINRLVVQN